MKLHEDALHRYARQIVLPGVGGRGQRRLLDSRVAVVGAGGLGSPVLFYLAAAGVGRIVLIDNDEVSLDNLQRQILFTTADIGLPKATRAVAVLNALNPDVAIDPKVVRLDAENAAELLANVDVVIDGCDNFATRYAVNDACLRLGIPFISGAIFRFEGQVCIFPNDGAPDSPCYRCLYREAPPPGTVPGCQEAGVLGPVAGVVGSMMAGEAAKLLLGLGEPLNARLCLYDLLAGTTSEVLLHRDRECRHSAAGG